MTIKRSLKASNLFSGKQTGPILEAVHSPDRDLTGGDLSPDPVGVRSVKEMMYYFFEDHGESAY